MTIVNASHVSPACLSNLQASFLQADLPLHVALTKHKVCRRRSSSTSASRSTSTRNRRQPGDGGGEQNLDNDEDDGVGDDDDDDDDGDALGDQRSLVASSGAATRRGEIVGTAEVDWRWVGGFSVIGAAASPCTVPHRTKRRVTHSKQ